MAPGNDSAITSRGRFHGTNHQEAMQREMLNDQEEVINVLIGDPKNGGSEPDHSEESGPDNDVTDYDDAPSDGGSDAD